MQPKMVSISCITYNHEKFIADAIESFLMQKTNFPYEILIHDDASTDGTPAIIRKYEKEYPDIIKTIYQTENQHSQGKKVGRFNIERAKGKYIAICEGDDYFTDPYKLQKQVDFMEKHEECSLCVHAAHRVRPDKSITKPDVRPAVGNKTFTVDDVIWRGGGFIATNSMMYPARLGNNIPAFWDNAPVGDYPLAIYLSLCGSVHYIDEFMSAYRVGVQGSWTDTMYSAENAAQRIRFNTRIIHMLEDINKYSDYKYNEIISKTKGFHDFEILITQGKFKEAKKNYEEFYADLDAMTKISIFLKQYLPGLAEVLIKAKRKLKA